MKNLFNNIKKFIKEYYKVIIVYVLILAFFLVEFPYYISAPGGLINTDDKIETTESFKMSGSLNMAYNIIRYGNHNAADIDNNIGVVTAINDFDDNANEFVEFYYSWQLGGDWDWLTLNAGQFPIYTIIIRLFRAFIYR